MPSALSKEYVRHTVTAKRLGVAVDPTADTVQFSIIQSGDPSVWTAGDWETYNSTAGTAVARILIGPGSTIGQLAKGRWAVWMKVTDSPEVPVILASWIVVT